MNMSTFRMIRYMNGSVFSKARYMNGVGFEILARTPLPKLPPGSPPPPPPRSQPLIPSEFDPIRGQLVIGQSSPVLLVQKKSRKSHHHNDAKRKANERRQIDHKPQTNEKQNNQRPLPQQCDHTARQDPLHTTKRQRTEQNREKSQREQPQDNRKNKQYQNRSLSSFGGKFQTTFVVCFLF